VQPTANDSTNYAQLFLLHQSQFSLPSTVSYQIHFIGRPFVRLRVLLFLTSLDWSFSKESMPVTVIAECILLRLLYVAGHQEVFCWCFLQEFSM